MATSSPSPRGRVHKYDVFISYCVVDCKRDFGHWLKRELEDVGIRCFCDEFSLELGDDPGAKMLEALETATYGIVILSPRFFEKEWCMRELQNFGMRGRIVPIFYGQFEAIEEARRGAITGQMWTRFKRFVNTEAEFVWAADAAFRYSGFRLADEGWWRPCILQARDEMLRLLSKEKGSIRVTDDQHLLLAESPSRTPFLRARDERLRLLGTEEGSIRITDDQHLLLPDPPGLADPKTWEYDVFICHAGEIKLTWAEEVSKDLTVLGFHCFVDKESLKAGDSADEKMEKAAHEAPIGLVLFDEHFLNKPACLRELKIIVERGTLLIVLIGMTYDDFEKVLKTSPTALREESIKRILRTTLIEREPKESPSTTRQRIQYAVLDQFVSKVCPALPDTRRGLFYLLLTARALRTAFDHRSLSLSKLTGQHLREIEGWYSDLKSEVKKVDKAPNDRLTDFI